MSLKINHIASGSTGNAIQVDDGYSRLLFDAGITYSKLSKHIKISELSGVFVTHEHKDHCKAVPQLIRRGASVYASKGTKEAIGENEIIIVKDSSLVHVRSWIVKPFDVVHDVAEPLGFLFMSTYSKEKGIYIADSSFVNYEFKGLTHFIIECNYAEDILSEGSDPDFLKNRIRRSHFSFEKLQEFFALQDLSKAEEVHLIHLSDRNSDADRFITDLQKQIGVPVYVKE